MQGALDDADILHALFQGTFLGGIQFPLRRTYIPGVKAAQAQAFLEGGKILAVLEDTGRFFQPYLFLSMPFQIALSRCLNTAA